MDMEERYRLIMNTIFNAIGLKVEVERMLSTGRIRYGSNHFSLYLTL